MPVGNFANVSVLPSPPRVFVDALVLRSVARFVPLPVCVLGSGGPTNCGRWLPVAGVLFVDPAPRLSSYQSLSRSFDAAAVVPAPGRPRNRSLAFCERAFVPRLTASAPRFITLVPAFLSPFTAASRVRCAPRPRASVAWFPKFRAELVAAFSILRSRSCAPVAAPLANRPAPSAAASGKSKPPWGSGFIRVTFVCD